MISDQGIKSVMRQANRFYLASLQDESPVVGYLHASYAVSLLDMLLGLAGRQRITQVTGVDWDKVRFSATRSQDKNDTILRQRVVKI